MELTTKQSNNKDFFVASCPGCSKRMRLTEHTDIPSVENEPNPAKSQVRKI
jgi:hypothetical protein